MLDCLSSSTWSRPPLLLAGFCAMTLPWFSSRLLLVCLLFSLIILPVIHGGPQSCPEPPPHPIPTLSPEPSRYPVLILLNLFQTQSLNHLLYPCLYSSAGFPCALYTCVCVYTKATRHLHQVVSEGPQTQPGQNQTYVLPSPLQLIFLMDSPAQKTAPSSASVFKPETGTLSSTPPSPMSSLSLNSANFIVQVPLDFSPFPLPPP